MSGTVLPKATDIAPADPANSGTALWNKLLKVPAVRSLYDSEVKLQVFIQGIWGLQYVALATHWMIKDEVSCMVFAHHSVYKATSQHSAHSRNERYPLDTL